MYNPAMQIPYTADELLVMIEPDNESKEGAAMLASSIEGANEAVNQATLISVQGTQDAVSMIEGGRGQVNQMRNMLNPLVDSSHEPTTQLEEDMKG